MKEAEVKIAVALVTYAQAPEAIEPSEEAFHFPAMAGDLAMRARAVPPLTAWFDAALRNAVVNATPMEIFAGFAAVVTAIRR